MEALESSTHLTPLHRLIYNEVVVELSPDTAFIIFILFNEAAPYLHISFCCQPTLTC